MCEQMVQSCTRQCSSWDWTRDLQSQVQLPNHCATEPPIFFWIRADLRTSDEHVAFLCLRRRTPPWRSPEARTSRRIPSPLPVSWLAPECRGPPQHLPHALKSELKHRAAYQAEGIQGFKVARRLLHTSCVHHWPPSTTFSQSTPPEYLTSPLQCESDVTLLCFVFWPDGVTDNSFHHRWTVFPVSSSIHVECSVSFCPFFHISVTVQKWTRDRTIRAFIP